METKLMPIFELRAMCLKTLSPQYYARNADLIRRTSLAAQDYVLSGDIYEINPVSWSSFKNLPGYTKVHAKYNLPYATHANPFESTGLNPGLVMDLAQALKTDAFYIGMIGSSSKKASVYKALRAQGVSDAALDKVCCPIGLGIGADTPQQIAVSVVAELMAARAGTLGALRAAR